MNSYFIDTNYFLRLLLKDNRMQFEKVKELFEETIKGSIAAYTSVIVFFEIYWVLASFYKKNKTKCIHFLRKILKMDFVKIEDREILRKALELFELSSLDLEDCYNIAFYKSRGIGYFASFDRKIAHVTSL